MKRPLMVELLCGLSEQGGWFPFPAPGTALQIAMESCSCGQFAFSLPADKLKESHLPGY